MRWSSLSWWPRTVAVLVACAAVARACGPGRGAGGRKNIRKPRPLVFKQHLPNAVENSLAASGPAEGAIDRRDRRFQDLVLNYNQDIIFKDEEGTAADRVMTQRCQEKLNTLAITVMNQWPGIRLRVTEGWDEEGHHSANSLHYEGRAVDITTSDRDRSKYGMLAALAKEAGFDWVYYESRNHIHCSVKSEPTHGKYGGCFPADSTVTTASGARVRLADLRAGDRVLSVDLATGRAAFADVLLFLDRDPRARRRFLRLRLRSGRAVAVTPQHLLLGANLTARFAADFAPGDVLHVVPDDPELLLVRDEVADVSWTVEEGVFAPLTTTGTVVVDGVAASCYAAVDSQEIAHAAMAPVRLLRNLVEGVARAWRLLSRPVRGWAAEVERGGGERAGEEVGVGVFWYARVLYAIGNYVIPSRMYSD